jgi:hypothetical protein
MLHLDAYVRRHPGTRQVSCNTVERRDFVFRHFDPANQRWRRCVTIEWAGSGGWRGFQRTREGVIKET